jgi:hypothetical protein
MTTKLTLILDTTSKARSSHVNNKFLEDKFPVFLRKHPGVSAWALAANLDMELGTEVMHDLVE